MDWFARIEDEKKLSSEHGGNTTQDSGSILRVGMALSLNKGGYAFTKLNVDLATPVTWESRDEAYKETKRFLEEMMGVLIARLKGNYVELPKFQYGTPDQKLNIRLSRGETVPLDNYESAKIYVSYSTDVISKDLSLAQDDIIKWIDEKIVAEVNEVK